MKQKLILQCGSNTLCQNEGRLDVSLLKPLLFYHALLLRHQTWCRCRPDVVAWFAEVKKLYHHIYRGNIGYKMKRKNWDKKKKCSFLLWSICIYSATVASMVMCSLWTQSHKYYLYSHIRITTIDFGIMELYPFLFWTCHFWEEALKMAQERRGYCNIYINNCNIYIKNVRGDQ